MTDQILDDLLGSPRLPNDPPAELDGKPIAKNIWIRLVSSNSAIRELDFHAVIDYCILAEQLAEVRVMLKASKPGGMLNRRLRTRIANKQKLMIKIYRDFYPGTPPESNPPGLAADGALTADELKQLEELMGKVAKILRTPPSGPEYPGAGRIF